MPWGLKRYQQARQLHFVTFSCHRRDPLLASARAKNLFEHALERTRQGYGFYVTGYVVMPEHVHLLISEPERETLARALHVIRGLVERPEDWAWSSFRHYSTGEEGAVEIESQWTARRRERMGIVPRLGQTEIPTRANPARDRSYRNRLSKCSGRPLGLCGRLPQLNLIPVQVIDPGKATVGFIQSFGVNLYSLLF